jgi:hypothetical protein
LRADSGTLEHLDEQESIASLDAGLILSPRLVLSTGLAFRNLERSGWGRDDLPRQSTTTELPLGLRLFHPNGMFGSLVATGIHQDLDFREGRGAYNSSWTGAIVDASAGYRLSSDRAVVALEIRNVFGTDIRFDDYPFADFADAERRYPEDRQILLRARISF